MPADLKILSAEFLADRDRILAFIHGLVRDPGVAEDIFQEVWIKLAEAAQQGIEIESVPRWSRGVAKNLILHYWRSQRGSRCVYDERLLAVAAKGFEEQDARLTDWRYLNAVFAGCVEKLPDRGGALLKLRFVEGLSTAEIGAKLSKSYDSVRIALGRMRQRVEECVQKQMALDGREL